MVEEARASNSTEEKPRNGTSDDGRLGTTKYCRNKMTGRAPIDTVTGCVPKANFWTIWGFAADRTKVISGRDLRYDKKQSKN